MAEYRIKYTDEDGDGLNIEPANDTDTNAYVYVHSEGVNIPKSDAPRIAAVLLRAAGWERLDAAAPRTEQEDRADDVLYSLDRMAETIAAESAATADAAKLDAEAEALWVAYREAIRDYVRSWDELPDETRNDFRAVARRARQLHGGAE